ncbi:MAG TPA: HD domain-containing protein [Chryseosolibacter sp.]
MNNSEIEIIRYVTGYADRAHGNQMRKYTNDRYIVHPVRVMEMVREYDRALPVLCAALLHDVLEDTPVTADEILLELTKVMDANDAEKTVELVIELTDVFVKSNYPRLNRRTRKEKEALRLSAVSAQAQTIKYADIIDNVNDHLTQDADFARVYLQEAKKMLHRMRDGNPVLLERAVHLVDECLHRLKPAA